MKEEAEGSPHAVLASSPTKVLWHFLFMSFPHVFSIFRVFLSVFFTIIISFLTNIVCAGFSSNFNKSIYSSAYLHVAIRVVTSETENQPQTLLGNASGPNTMP